MEHLDEAKNLVNDLSISPEVLSNRLMFHSQPNAFIRQTRWKNWVLVQPPFGKSLLARWHDTSTKLLHKLFMKRVEFEVGENGNFSFIPQPKLPVAEHVRSQGRSDHEEGILQPPSKYHFQRLSRLNDSSEIFWRKVRFTKFLTIRHQPISERVTIRLQCLRILQKCSNSPVCFSEWKSIERICQ